MQRSPPGDVWHQPAAPPQGFTILIAERNDHFRETIRRVLASYEQCTVVGEATTFSQALVEIRAHMPDLVLVDLNLVPKGAFKALRRMAGQFPDIKIAVLLPDYTPEYRSAARTHGALYCVGKDHLEEHLAWVIFDAKEKSTTGARSI